MAEFIPFNLDQILGRSLVVEGFAEEAEANLTDNKMLLTILLERILGAAEQYGVVEFNGEDYPHIIAERDPFHLLLVPSQFGNMNFRLHWATP